VLGLEEASSALAYLRTKIESAVASLPLHAQFLAEHCRINAPMTL
jgi:hypothetical protein